MNFTDHAQISAIHFADDSTFYKSFKATQVNQVAKELEKTILNQFKIDQIRETWFSMPLKQNQCYFWNGISKRLKLLEKDTFAMTKK